jgi:hypothetical protein
LSTFTLCSSLSVSDQVSHPYKTTGKIIVFILCFFLNQRRTQKNYSRTPLIRINRDGEPSGYAENPINLICLWK